MVEIRVYGLVSKQLRSENHVYNNNDNNSNNNMDILQYNDIILYIRVPYIICYIHHATSQ